MKAYKPLLLLVLLILLSGMLILTGCDKSNPDTLTADRDAAESIAGAIGLNTGGALDQINDLCDFLIPGEIGETKLKDYRTGYQRVVSYNVGTGVWTIDIVRERQEVGETPYAYMTRKYSLQFLNEGGFPQMLYITGADTARTVHFNVLQGTGIHRTRRISQQLDSLYASWTITEANHPIVTINGDYHRAAVDTISGWNRLRTSDHTMHLTFTDIRAPRGGQPAYPYFYQAVSGNISGTFDAMITFLHGDAYNETTLHRTINIVLGEGKGNIEIGNSSYKASLVSGELTQ